MIADVPVAHTAATTTISDVCGTPTTLIPLSTTTSLTAAGRAPIV